MQLWKEVKLIQGNSTQLFKSNQVIIASGNKFTLLVIVERMSNRNFEILAHKQSTLKAQFLRISDCTITDEAISFDQGVESQIVLEDWIEKEIRKFAFKTF